MKQMFKNAWGANALNGQLIMSSFGFFVAMIEVLVLKREPNLEVISNLCLAMAFATYLLAAHGKDREKENIPFFILTFATSSVLGNLGGLIVLADKMSISLLWAFIVFVAVATSFWTVGPMSRDYRKQIIKEFGQLSPSMDKILEMLMLEQYHKRADALMMAIEMWQDEDVIKKGGLLDQAVEILSSGRDEKFRSRLSCLAEKIRSEISEEKEPEGHLTGSRRRKHLILR